MKINVFNEKNQKFQKNFDKHYLKKRNYIKHREILLDRILVDSTTEKLDNERKKKEVQKKSKIVDYDKDLQNITDNRQYRKKKINFTVMLLNTLFHLLKKLQKVVRLLLI